MCIITQRKVDEILLKLLNLKNQKSDARCGLSLDQITYLCKESRQIFLEQDIVLELRAFLVVCGDIHGQFSDLICIFEARLYPPHSNYLLLGDYVDRGDSIEVICLLLAYKIRYPQNFFILRGNHESRFMNISYGFQKECLTFYNQKIWEMFCDVFNCLPIAAIIDDKIFCIHGGISLNLRNIDDFRTIVLRETF